MWLRGIRILRVVVGVVNFEGHVILRYCFR